MEKDCEYLGCKHNSFGVCYEEECMEEEVYGTCLYCGADLVKGSDSVPYGDTFVSRWYWYCNECD